VPNDYDPLLSKLIAWGNSREETIARLRRALEEYTITGIKTNAGLFRRILTEPDFLRGEIHTRWLDELLSKRRVTVSDTADQTLDASRVNAALIAAAAWHAIQSISHLAAEPASAAVPSRWKLDGRSKQLDRMP
jgi:acetyl-CoA carboxylase, biotin carboxylase subunit